MNTYINSVYENLKNRYFWETEFLQSVAEVFGSISKLFERDPRYERYKILEQIIEPERIVSFKIPWVDDRGVVHVNRGYRVQFNSAIGPYKGGLRFHPTVNQSILKFLGFEQMFKNSLTGLSMGGAKGGADFDPKGKSEFEIMRFCQAFMSELFRHVGSRSDIPAGDIGVGAREIGYLYGQYKKVKNKFDGVLTGKGANWGGSLVRPEATGYGLCYFVAAMLKTKGDSLEGKTVCLSGSGNVAWGAAKKLKDLGTKVVTVSGSKGFVYDKEGINTDEKLDYLLTMRASSGKEGLEDYAKKFKATFTPGKKPWGIPCDIALPCATQNELDENDAKILIQNGCKMIAEGANLPTTEKALELLLNAKILFGPAKAANAGGVACSGLEMSQNSTRLAWTKEEVDLKLRLIMEGIHELILETSKEYGEAQNYVLGANIAGFKKVADAMIDLGVV